MAFIIVQIILAFVYSLFLEWALHKHVLHGIGKKRGSPMSFHFFEHHGQSRMNNFIDPAYKRLSIRPDNGSGKEIISLVLLSVLHLPLLFILPWAFLTLMLCVIHYFVIHMMSHRDPQWARLWLPWHYAHHMAPNQESNWGVRFDWIDRLLGTREYYVGTKREAKDIARRARRKSR